MVQTNFATQLFLIFLSYYNNDWTTFPDYYRQFLAQFFLAQIDGFETGGRIDVNSTYCI